MQGKREEFVVVAFICGEIVTSDLKILEEAIVDKHPLIPLTDRLLQGLIYREGGSTPFCEALRTLAAHTPLFTVDIVGNVLRDDYGLLTKHNVNSIFQIINPMEYDNACNDPNNKGNQ